MNKIIIFLIFLFFLQINNLNIYAQIKKYETYLYPFALSRDSLQKEKLYEQSLNYYLDNLGENESYTYYYQIAVNYAFLSKIDSAYYYLYKYLNCSPDDRIVLIDYAFDNLRKDSAKWKTIESRIENDYFESLPECCSDSTIMLSLFYLSIQKEKYRFFSPFFNLSDTLFEPIANGEKEILFLKSDIPEIKQHQEETNRTFLKILQQNGFPNYACDGGFADAIAYNILSEIVLDRKMYDSISQLFAIGRFNPTGYAYITDFWLAQMGKKQLYGTRYVNKKKKNWENYRKMLYPVKNITELDMRRKCMNFSETIQQYANRKSIILPEKVAKRTINLVSNEDVSSCLKKYEI